MAMSGTYVAEVPLKGSVEKHYKRWKSENHLFPDAVGHHIQGVNMHHGDWESHGSIRSWNYTCGLRVFEYEDGKQEFKEKRELDDENMAVTLRGVGGHVMDPYKVYDVIFQFIPKSKERLRLQSHSDMGEENRRLPRTHQLHEVVKSLVADMDDHILKGQNKA